MRIQNSVKRVMTIQDSGERGYDNSEFMGEGVIIQNSG